MMFIAALCGVVCAAATTTLPLLEEHGVSFGSGESAPINGDLGSDDAGVALRNAAATGVTHVRLTVTWYVSQIDNATIAPIVVPGSPLRSTSDDGLAAAIDVAAAAGLKVMLSPQVRPFLLIQEPLQLGTSFHSHLIEFKFTDVNTTLAAARG